MNILVPFSYRCFPSHLIGQAVSEKRIFEYSGYIHVYCPRVGADQPLGSKFAHKYSIHLLIPRKFSVNK